jgi:hypothetical protein
MSKSTIGDVDKRGLSPYELSARQHHHRKLWVARRVQQARWTVCEAFGPGSLPVWLSDYRRLIYQNDRQLFIVDTQTKQSRPIYAIPGEVVEFPALSKDTRFLYDTHGVTGADIWLMTIK